MIVTPLYAGILALVFVVLSIRVIQGRYAARAALGDGGDRVLFRRQRAHANFAEYVPLVLVLMAFLELQSGAPWLVHAIGALLLVGRLLHAYGISCEPETIKFRQAGMAMTFSALIVGGAANLGLALGKYLAA